MTLSVEKALMLFNRGKKPNAIKLIFSPFIRFIKSYFIKLGFLDGIDGLCQSWVPGMLCFSF